MFFQRLRRRRSQAAPRWEGAVVEDPEDPSRRAVGRLAHHLLDEPLEGRDPGPLLAPAEDLRPPDVPGGEVGEGARSFVLVLDPDRLARPGRRPWVDPSPGLDARLLVGGHDVLVGAESTALPAAGIQIEDRAGSGGEVGVAREDPAAVAPGPDRVLTEPAPEGRPGDRRGDATRDDRPAQLGDAEPPEGQPELRRPGAGERLHLNGHRRGKNGRVGRPSVDRRARPGPLRRTACATCSPPGGACRA